MAKEEKVINRRKMNQRRTITSLDFGICKFMQVLNETLNGYLEKWEYLTKGFDVTVVEERVTTQDYVEFLVSVHPAEWPHDSCVVVEVTHRLGWEVYGGSIHAPQLGLRGESFHFNGSDARGLIPGASCGPLADALARYHTREPK